MTVNKRIKERKIKGLNFIEMKKLR